MLDIRNQGKILSKDFEKKRNKGLKDYSIVGDDYDFLELEFPDGYGKDNERTYTIRSRFKNKKIDLREREGLGEAEEEK